MYTTWNRSYKRKTIYRLYIKTMTKKFKILFFGTPEFSAFQLKNIIRNTKHKILGVITKKNKKINPVKKIALKNNLNIFEPKTIEELKKLHKKIKILKINLILIIAYGFILPKKIINIPKYGCINMHASLLPRWRGSSPIQHSILYGDKYSGITFIKINQFIDSGKIIYQKKCIIKKKYTYQKLYKKLKKIGAKYTPKVLKYIKNKNYKKIKQNKKYITFAKKIKKIDGLINWNKDTAYYIERKIKAFNKWPKTFFYHKKYIIFIWSIKIKKTKRKFTPGEVLKYNKKGLEIFTKKSYILKIKKIQLNNHKKIKISELINSKPNLFIPGEKL